MEKNQYKLEGLTCANCAGKIEERIADVEGFDNVVLNFTTQTLSFKASKEDYKVFLQEEINAIEKGVVVSDKSMKKDHHSKVINPIIWVRLGMGGGLFLLGLVSTLPWAYELTIYLAAYLIIGGDVLLKAGRNILRGKVFDENFLMSIATIGAFAIGEYPEGVTVMLFYQVGELFQNMAIQRSRQSIASLMDIRPDVAWVKEGSGMRSVAAASVEIGDSIYVKPGERIPLDGEVVKGQSMLDTSALTGEAVPRQCGLGDQVLSGVVNQTSLIEIKVGKLFGESTVAKILDLVENASNKKADTEKFITKFARYYTPIVVYLALALAFLPPLFIEGATLSDWVHRALIFLVVSCPCALVISIPLGFFGGIGGASKHGILIKGSNYLEALKNVDTIIFDKTGTLTKGVFKVTEIHAINGSKDALVETAAFVESQSNHPIAKSIMTAYGKKVALSQVSGLEEVPGKGLRAYVEGQEVLVGNHKLMHAFNINYEPSTTMGTIVYVAKESCYLGYLIISDEIKEDSASAIKALKAMGIKKIVMLTGDRKAVGEGVGSAIGIDEVYAELLPHEKVEHLEALLSEQNKGKTIFVGDGINDAPVLARADVGVAMGGIGSDAAIEAADVVLMTDEPSKLVDALKVARRTNGIVWQNIIFAMGVKVIVLILGAGGLATMWEAVFADVGVALIAIINAMRIIHKPIG